MGTAANQRVAPGRVLLILVLLLAVWLGFEFYPRKKPVPPMAPVAAESKLRSVGLQDNVDLEGLPDFFAAVADKAEWKDGRTRFAYWHPVMKTYSYYFEATRDGAGFRFKEIVEPRDLDYVWEETPDDGRPIRFYYSDSFTIPAMPVSPSISRTVHPPPRENKITRPDQVKAPPVDLKLQPPAIEPKR